MKAATVTNLKSPRTIRSTAKKKTTKSTKSKTNAPNVVHPKLRQQMIEEAAYFKALNRDFQGDCCEEDWFEAETEIDVLMNGEFQDHVWLDDQLDAETEIDTMSPG